MKTVRLIISIISIMALGSCNQKVEPDTLLENPETRNELLTAIADNHGYMMEFMQKMQESDHAMQMMQGNQHMMGNMMQGGGMQMMMKDSMMMNQMMKAMIQDGHMMGNMMQMMHENGMMSNNCMQSGMKMMEEKGMDMKGMGMMIDGKK